MPNNIYIDWSNRTTIDDEDFPKDTLGRVKYAQFLTQFLVGQGYDTSRPENEMKRNYVLNLNSEWGSGKTYFLKRWSNDLKSQFPVVYIDAWKQDYSDDPLMTVISSVIKQLREQAGMEEDTAAFKVSNKIIGLLKAAAPGFARSVAKRYFDIDPVAVMQAEEGDNLGEIKGSDGEPMDMSVMASNMVKHLIDEHDAKSNAIRDLKTNISQWIETVLIQKKLLLPAFIFIDELDRCRPSYAVEMLETIKHIFDIKGIVFVVATDTEQLQHAVKAIYGEGFDARLYLGRFFNSRFSLKAPDLKDFLEVHVDHQKLSGEYIEQAGISTLPPNIDGKATLNNIALILDAFKMPPRTAIQITDRVIATLSNMPKDSKIDLLMLTTLLCLCEEDNESFQKIISGTYFYQLKNTQKVGVSGYLKSRFKENISIITMYFNPVNRFNKLSVSKYNTVPNKYSEMTYSLKLTKYFENIFPIIFSTNKDIEDIEKIENTLVTHMGQLSIPLEIGALWLQALYIKEGLNKITKEQYKDYVELASALDWIDGDSGANDA
ncbi:P-loop NTPase fold protein [Marinomonas arenicola]|uniref:KAP family P-loop NTPase fold protein n=1 Tax=Marinomonas arenicola TaxID=569601 RepID=UPI00311FF153